MLCFVDVILCEMLMLDNISGMGVGVPAMIIMPNCVCGDRISNSSEEHLSGC